MFVVISSAYGHYRFMLIFVFSCLTRVALCDIPVKSSSNNTPNDDKSQSANNEDDIWDCKLLDACSDKLGFDAIQALHYQLDDDANGDVDVTETDEFLRDELKYENGYERQKGFHRNDKHITVDELWRTWKSSEVHNWTVEETVTWLVSNVELPQYTQNFQENEVNGSTLPRMAVNSLHFLSNVLGIKDPIHKQKISLKAMDVVLFGIPKSHNYVKDVVLVFSLIIATCGCWFAYVQHKYSQSQMRKMMKDMEGLQYAEESLSDLQRELDQAKLEQEIVATEKKKLELRLQDEISTGKQQQDLSLSSDADQSKISELQEKLRAISKNLHSAEKALQDKSWVPPPALQHWLQMTHELELRHYNGKKAAAEQQLTAAKEGCEKLRKKRSTFMGAFRVAHGSSIDDVDNRILQAKAALSEVTKDLQERLHRWKQIEGLCGFPIVHNPGLLHLQSLLGGAMKSSILSSRTTVKQRINRTGSENTLADDESFPSGVSARSLANIPAGCSPLLGVCPDARPFLPRKSLSSDLKPCASSSAILQRSDAICVEHPSEMLFVEESQKDILDDMDAGDTFICSTASSPEQARPVFTVGGSNKDVIARSPLKTNLSSSHDDPKLSINSTAKVFSPLENNPNSPGFKENCSLQLELNKHENAISPNSFQEGKDFSSTAGDGKILKQKSIVAQRNNQKTKIS